MTKIAPKAPRPQVQSDPSRAFDRYAASYDADLQRGLAVSGEKKEYFARGRLEHLRHRLAEREGLPKTVVDFGCGDGSTSVLFHDILGAQSVVGVDTSRELLDRATTTYGSATTRFQATAEPILPESIDLVFCNGVLHHIAPSERATAIASIHRMLAPGGHFALWENNPWNPGTRWVMHRIPFDRDAIPIAPPQGRRLLEAAGFEVLATDFAFVFPRWLRWFRPLERHLVPWPVGAQYLLLGGKPG